MPVASSEVLGAGTHLRLEPASCSPLLLIPLAVPSHSFPPCELQSVCATACSGGGDKFFSPAFYLKMRKNTSMKAPTMEEIMELHNMESMSVHSRL